MNHERMEKIKLEDKITIKEVPRWMGENIALLLLKRKESFIWPILQKRISYTMCWKGKINWIGPTHDVAKGKTEKLKGPVRIRMYITVDVLNRWYVLKNTICDLDETWYTFLLYLTKIVTKIWSSIFYCF